MALWWHDGPGRGTGHVYVNTPSGAVCLGSTLPQLGRIVIVYAAGRASARRQVALRRRGGHGVATLHILALETTASLASRS